MTHDEYIESLDKAIESQRRLVASYENLERQWQSVAERMESIRTVLFYLAFPVMAFLLIGFAVPANHHWGWFAWLVQDDPHDD